MDAKNFHINKKTMQHFTSCGVLGIGAKKMNSEDMCGKGTVFLPEIDQCVPKPDVCLEGSHLNKETGKCQENFKITDAFHKSDKECLKDQVLYEKQLGPQTYKTSPLACAEACATNTECKSFLSISQKGEDYDGLCQYFTESIGKCELKDTETWVKKPDLP